jgi:hypothetical protein
LIENIDTQYLFVPKMPSKRASLIEAHEIFTKYHRHREGEGDEKELDGEGAFDLGGRDHKVNKIYSIHDIGFYDYGGETTSILLLSLSHSLPVFRHAWANDIVEHRHTQYCTACGTFVSHVPQSNEDWCHLRYQPCGSTRI